MQEAQKLIPNSRLEIVPGAAHSAHFEQPEAFNRLVGDFFAEIQDKIQPGTATVAGDN